MSIFDYSFEKLIKNEGGYVLHTISGDTGGQTFAGIARNYHPSWNGWNLIDSGDLESDELKSLVSDFYKRNFWDPLKCDNINSERVAFSIFDFGVNAGVRTSAKLAQRAVNEKDDGIIGPMSLHAINEMYVDEFLDKFTIEKIRYYAAIVNRDRSQSKFLLGWINRSLS